MATYSGGGLTREIGELFKMQVLDATSIDDAGYVLALNDESSVHKVDLCSSTEVPFAVNYRSTRDPHDMNFPNTLFKIGSEIGEQGIPVVREGWAKLKVATNNTAAVRGDPVVCTGGGKVDLYTPSALTTTSASDLAADLETRFNDMARIVGNIEEEDLIVGTTGAPGQDKVLVHLTIRKNGIIT